VHASGIPCQDDSGDRLREWTRLDGREFYDPAKVALVPMGFCYPGKAGGGDAPPRRECAPRWHGRILERLPTDRLTLLVGSYAQQYYLPKDADKTLVDRVRAFERFAPAIFPYPASVLAERRLAKTQPVVRGRTAPPAARRDKVPA
jgi:uracil-DNA glycosylase